MLPFGARGCDAAIAGARDPSCRRRSCRTADILKTVSHAGIEVRAVTANSVLGHPRSSYDQQVVRSRCLFSAPSAWFMDTVEQPVRNRSFSHRDLLHFCLSPLPTGYVAFTIQIHTFMFRLRGRSGGSFCLVMYK